MSGELFMEMTGAKMTHVPYRGSNPALTDLMGGQCQVLFDNMPSSIELIKGGKIRALARHHGEARQLFPGSADGRRNRAGLRGQRLVRHGRARRERRRTSSPFSTSTIEEALADPKIKARIADLGGAPMGGTPEDFGKIIVSETAKWKKVVEFSGASVE